MGYFALTFCYKIIPFLFIDWSIMSIPWLWFLLHSKQSFNKLSLTCPPSHRTLPQRNETFESLDAASLRLQDYAFTQRFALVTEKNYKKHSTLVLNCSRHHKDTRNYRKLSEKDRIRKNAKVSFNDCKYRLRLQQYKGETGWKFKHHERISRSWYGCWSFYVSQTLMSRSRS